MSGQPDAPRVPGGTDAVETSPGSGDELARDGQAARVEEAGAVPGAGADGVATGPGAAGGSVGNGPGAGVSPAVSISRRTVLGETFTPSLSSPSGFTTAGANATSMGEARPLITG